MDTINLTIDGYEVEVKRGRTVLQAAQKKGIYIPTLCYHQDLVPFGACRLCIVEIKNMKGFPTSCTTPAAEGMVVHTDTPRLRELRRNILELILSEHPFSCLTCSKSLGCELQKVARYVGVEKVTLAYKNRELPIHEDSPFFIRDYNFCILCGRCVRVCQELRRVGAIAFTYRGSQTIIGTAFNRSLKDAGCQVCGACVDVCPTAAISERAIQGTAPAEREVVTICPYCGVGCQIKLEIKDNKILRALPDENGPANHGQLCVKGRFGIDFVHDPGRLTSPLIKKNGEFVPVSWEEALDMVSAKFANYKGEQFAVISSAKCTNEENYIIQKFTRAVMVTNNVDHCARLCHAATVAGLAMVFGSGAMTNSIAEIRETSSIFAIGTNTTESHPVIALEIIAAVQKKGAKLIVANPMEIGLCRFAHLWLRHRPGTDVALLMGMARVILEKGWADKEFIAQRCENFESFVESVKQFDLDWVAQVTGVPASDIVEAARIYANERPASLIYCMGITQHSHGTDNVLAIANLAMLTGNVGRPSSGLNPLRGQNNVQGACDMGCLPNVYSGYQAVSDSTIRKKFEEAWGCVLSGEPGLTLTEIFDAVAAGRIKALYLIGDNPLFSNPDARHVEEALRKLEFLVVQDIFLTETAKLAHVVFPAVTFAEKDGTFTNTERRVQRVRQAIKPVGDSRPDWWITCQIAKRLNSKGFDFTDPSQIMDEISRLTPSYGGISYQRLEDEGLQWPCPTFEHPGTPILHTERFVRGKGRFTALSYRPAAEEPDKDYPLFLTTGRCLYQYHTSTMTGKVSGLNTLRGEELVEINPKDAQVLGIVNDDKVRVSSRRGQVWAKAKVTEKVPPGVVFMTFHFAESPTNLLTNPVLDPVAKIPELKVCAVKVEKC